MPALIDVGQAVQQVVGVIGDFGAAGFVFGDDIDVIVGIVAGDDAIDVATGRELLFLYSIEVIAGL